MEQFKGMIRKGIGGFYDVEAADAVYICRARGILRKEGITPLAGDSVMISVENGSAVIDEVLPRKNSLVRPPVANLDLLFLVLSMADPAPNLPVADKMLVIAEDKGIEPVIILTKCDLASPNEIADLYRKAGFTVLVKGECGDLAEKIGKMMPGKIAAFAGNSGAGKSTLLNLLDPSLGLPTAEISKKLGRGRHTTRQVELYPFCGGYLADSPGFSELSPQKYEPISAENLPFCFREFLPHIDHCRFTGCSHTCEKGCAILAAMEKGEIAPSRHESYCRLYEEAKEQKSWEK